MSDKRKLLKVTKKKCVDCDMYSVEVANSSKYKVNLCTQCLVGRLIADK